MPGVGGSIESISIDASEYSVPADADINKNLGGFENEVVSNGDGTVRVMKTRVPMSLKGVQISIDDSAGDQERIQTIADGNETVPIAITFASGEVYAGEGYIVGETQTSSQTQIMTFDIAGPGKLVRQ